MSGNDTIAVHMFEGYDNEVPVLIVETVRYMYLLRLVNGSPTFEPVLDLTTRYLTVHQRANSDKPELTVELVRRCNPVHLHRIRAKHTIEANNLALVGVRYPQIGEPGSTAPFLTLFGAKDSEQFYFVPRTGTYVPVQEFLAADGNIVSYVEAISGNERHTGFSHVLDCFTLSTLRSTSPAEPSPVLRIRRGRV